MRKRKFSSATLAHREYLRLYQQLLDAGVGGVIDFGVVKCNAGEGFEHRETWVPSNDLLKQLSDLPEDANSDKGRVTADDGLNHS